jgi:hypothetical protein
MSTLLRSAIATVLLCLCISFAQTVAWSPNHEPDLAGYHLYFTPERGLQAASTNNLSASTTNAALPSLPRGIYSLTLTAYNTAGLESDPAGPLLWTNNGTLSLNLETSTDLAHWSSLNLCTQSISLNRTQTFYRATLSLK